MKKKTQRKNTCYLEHVKVTSFGKLSNIIVGPFLPGLNVVYGPNESGKTTVNELIKGVLFGWTASRKGVNSYKPEGSDRVGSLFFKNSETNRVAELKRIKNTDEIIDEFNVLSDIDAETYARMFALTSDELLGLDRHNEITTRLLTAGSGTSTSPAQALEEINSRIKVKMSRASANNHSIVNLQKQRSTLNEEIQEGLQEANYYRAQEKKLEALSIRKESLTATQTTLNAEIELLKARHARMQALEQLIQESKQKIKETTKSGETLLSDTTLDDIDEEIYALSKLSASEEFQLLDYLEEKEHQQIKAEHATENAQKIASKSQTEYELLNESQDVAEERRRVKIQRRVQILAAVVISLCMAAIGVYAFIYGQVNVRFSYTLLGLMAIVGALIVAVGGVAINIRPPRIEDSLDEKLKKAEWVMKQDKKNLAKTKQQEELLQGELQSYMDTHYLSAAQGSIRRARNMLERAKKYRMQQEIRTQNERALSLQEATLRKEMREAQQQRIDILQGLGLPPTATIEDLELHIKHKEEERNSIIALNNNTYRQYGEINQELQQARYKQDFDQKKLELELVESCLNEEYKNLAVLLLAKRTLEQAIEEWESKSQPEVYRRASHLLSEMTHGKWQQVYMNSRSELKVLDSLKTEQSPQLLSLGTRQQLYLSLRISLLIMSENIGKSLPVLCDDILVNFDEQRRIGAIKALFELSKYRQVIIFTCHPEIVSLVQSIDSSVNFLEL